MSKQIQTGNLLYITDRDDECVDLDDLEEMEEKSAPKEKSKGPPI